MLFFASLVKILICNVTENQNKMSMLASCTKTYQWTLESGIRLRNVVYCCHSFAKVIQVENIRNTCYLARVMAQFSVHDALSKPS